MIRSLSLGCNILVHVTPFVSLSAVARVNFVAKTDEKFKVLSYCGILVATELARAFGEFPGFM